MSTKSIYLSPVHRGLDLSLAPSFVQTHTAANHWGLPGFKRSDFQQVTFLPGSSMSAQSHFRQCLTILPYMLDSELRLSQIWWDEIFPLFTRLHVISWPLSTANTGVQDGRPSSESHCGFRAMLAEPAFWPKLTHICSSYPWHWNSPPCMFGSYINRVITKNNFKNFPKLTRFTSTIPDRANNESWKSVSEKNISQIGKKTLRELGTMAHVFL